MASIWRFFTLLSARASSFLSLKTATLAAPREAQPRLVPVPRTDLGLVSEGESSPSGSEDRKEHRRPLLGGRRGGGVEAGGGGDSPAMPATATPGEDKVTRQARRSHTAQGWLGLPSPAEAGSSPVRTSRC